ncbi:MAG TPA: phosphate ABC transporter permease subunit PstC [Anaerolineae bacterium]|nr:phosphate ABC transporter permease subunit PstC [Anaerolineae bacterium]
MSDVGKGVQRLRVVGLAGRTRKNPGDLVFEMFLFLMALMLIGLIMMLFVELLTGSWPAIQTFGWRFLVEKTWDPVREQFGALPAMYGTVVSSLLALAAAGPIGLLSAVFLAEFSPGWLERPLSFLIELLASIPSVVYGLWGLFVLVPILRKVETSLGKVGGDLPFFSCTPWGIGMFAAVVILSIMILPYTTAVARDVIRAVPRDQREAMLALGATRWEAIWHVVIPYARSGIIGGLMLALGRALGETMAVTMLIGNRPEMSLCLFNPAYTLASQIANEFTEATSEVYLAALVELGLVLFAITFIMNILARLLVLSVSGGMRGGRQ